jgi:cholesterol transport system auxiliary component
MRLLTLIIPTAFILVGCSPTVSPPISEYTIYPSTESIKPATTLSTKTLRMSRTKTIPSLSSKNLIYLAASGESGSYLYTQWSDSPSLLIERSLNHKLQSEAIFSTLISPASSAHVDWILESDLHAFYHRFESGQKSKGIIDITYYLINAKTKLPIESKRFFIITNAPTEDASGGISALVEATEELNNQCSQWLKEKVKQ